MPMQESFDRASEFLSRRLQESYSTLVSYKHNEDIYIIRGTPCKVPMDEIEESEWRTNADRMDFIFRSTDLPITPEEGDTILYKGFIYEVKRQAFEGPWRYSDTSMTLKRVHTQNIGEQA